MNLFLVREGKGIFFLFLLFWELVIVFDKKHQEGELKKILAVYVCPIKALD